ncbi:MAG: thermonuclease family protein [Candidatus Omnitrophica bacterium]|nr:thermonuclease family protein [Candidatus Omnitrophota bacterium]MBU1996033.1 thermonuclease family protein [Candidatus Omnitrophota bacterium]MBU4333393.1 thermonuclease family protein [Candidatus Omnitrophota bacterium]
MPKKKLNSSNAFNDLMAALKSEFIDGLVDAQNVFHYQRVKTYWEVGKDIINISERSNGGLSLGPKLYGRISAEIQKQFNLDIKSDTVKKIVYFSRNYRELPKESTLTFSHYITLLRVKDPVERARIENRAIDKSMKIADLKNEIYKLNIGRHKVDNNNTETIAIQRGEPYIYRVHSVRDIYGKIDFVIDCGFKISVPVEAGDHKTKLDFFKSNTCVVRVEKKDGIYNIISDDERGNKVYTYCARVIRVVDGDTLDVNIDVGFGIWLHERLRLKSINAPEAMTNAGKYSKQFLAKYLSKCPNIIIRTSKEGMYGRWLADVFALKNCIDPYKIAAEGEYLNQTLLDEGLAEVYK